PAPRVTHDSAGRDAAPPLAQPENAAATAAPAFVTGLESLPRSLRDIEVDGGLRADADGQLILDADIRRLFEFFLNAVGEEPADQVIARIRAYIQANLPPDAAAQAQQVLDEYLALRQAMDEAQASSDAQWSVFA